MRITQTSFILNNVFTKDEIEFIFSLTDTGRLESYYFSIEKVIESSNVYIRVTYNFKVIKGNGLSSTAFMRLAVICLICGHVYNNTLPSMLNDILASASASAPSDDIPTNKVFKSKIIKRMEVDFTAMAAEFIVKHGYSRTVAVTEVLPGLSNIANKEPTDVAPTELTMTNTLKLVRNTAIENIRIGLNSCISRRIPFQYVDDNYRYILIFNQGITLLDGYKVPDMFQYWVVKNNNIFTEPTKPFVNFLPSHIENIIAIIIDDIVSNDSVRVERYPPLKTIKE